MGNKLAKNFELVFTIIIIKAYYIVDPNYYELKISTISTITSTYYSKNELKKCKSLPLLCHAIELSKCNTIVGLG